MKLPFGVSNVVANLSLAQVAFCNWQALRTPADRIATLTGMVEWPSGAAGTTDKPVTNPIPVDCPAGSRQVTPFFCEACLAGTYTPASGISPCIACPYQTYGLRTGATACQKCPGGHYAAARPLCCRAARCRCRLHGICFNYIDLQLESNCGMFIYYS